MMSSWQNMWITHNLNSVLPIGGTDFPAQWEDTNQTPASRKTQTQRTGFPIPIREGWFPRVSFPRLTPTCLWGRVTTLPADSVHQDTLICAVFLCYNPENSCFSQGKQELQHPHGCLLFFGLKRKMNSRPSRKHAEPQFQTAAVQWCHLAKEHKILYVGNVFLNGARGELLSKNADNYRPCGNLTYFMTTCEAVIQWGNSSSKFENKMSRLSS